ncbi:MAG: hypothetical protein ACREHD_20755 [Pirellulales bacterium]
MTRSTSLPRTAPLLDQLRKRLADGRRLPWSVTAVTAMLAVVVGYVLGREHIKYELRSALSEAGKAFSEGMEESFREVADRSDVETEPSNAAAGKRPALRGDQPARAEPRPETGEGVLEPSTDGAGHHADASASQPRAPEMTELGEQFAAPEFQIALVGARIDRPEILDMFGEKGRAKSPDLLLTFRVKNTHDRKILRFREENGFLAGNFRLRDDVENVIRGVNYGIGNQPVGALTGNEDILPGKEATHIEAFGVPPPKTKFLTVSVDLAAFGGEGEAHFRIPAGRIENFSP